MVLDSGTKLSQDLCDQEIGRFFFLIECRVKRLYEDGLNFAAGQPICCPANCRKSKSPLKEKQVWLDSSLTLVSLKPMRLSGSGKHGTPRRSLKVESFFLLYQDLGWHMNKSIMKIANHQPGRS